MPSAQRPVQFYKNSGIVMKLFFRGSLPVVLVGLKKTERELVAGLWGAGSIGQGSVLVVAYCKNGLAPVVNRAQIKGVL